MSEIKIVAGVMDGVSTNLAFTPCESTMTALSAKDERSAILVKNGDATHAVGIYVEAGDGIRSSIGGLLCAVEAGETCAIMLDSMRFKKLSGEKRGSFVLKLCKKGDKETAFDGVLTSVGMAQIRL